MEPFRVPGRSASRSPHFEVEFSGPVFLAGSPPRPSRRDFRLGFSLRHSRVACVTCRVRVMSRVLVRRIPAPLFPRRVLLRGVFPCRAGGRSGPPPRAARASGALRALRRVPSVPSVCPLCPPFPIPPRLGPEPARVPPRARLSTSVPPPSRLRAGAVRALTGHDGD
ncbi:hypothetical protein GCM10010140_02270 [Streptosporangium pseudovulgare]|uniref:Uncharacterized protein n=1 Tax=Streptosporangium pseudovulgare TaxID=35765 RepID=A0ABQ2QEP6_9ACTN|nr:hypothetical protein GCM10010140_02270 [Streptosporangium pseudovulgare]